MCKCTSLIVSLKITTIIVGILHVIFCSVYYFLLIITCICPLKIVVFLFYYAYYLNVKYFQNIKILFNLTITS